MLSAKCIPRVGDPFDIGHVIEIRYLEKINQLGTFNIRLVSSAAERAKYDYKDRIEIYADGTLLFAGLIEEITHDDREIVISGAGSG